MKPAQSDAWDAALYAIRKLRAAGHTALLAGGCVRDRLLKLTPKDYDIATDATPAQVKEIFPRARHIGAKFGVMLVRRSGFEIEITTFRSDGPYSDGRHPDAVTFGTDVQDAHRRDFTINGLFFDPLEDRVIDYVAGREDLDAGVIRTIGDPERRFAEDHLRMLRAVRFGARLGFAIAPETTQAIRANATKLGKISPERIWLELEQILTAHTRARGWSLLVETGLHRHLAPRWMPTDQETSRISARLTALPEHFVAASLALASMLGDRSADEVGDVCRTLRISNRLADAATWLVRSLPVARREAALELADLKVLMAEASWPELLELLRIDLAVRGGDPEPFTRLHNRASAIRAEQVAPPPLVSGDDLGDLGLPPGPPMGEVLRKLYRAQLNEEITSREEALAAARTLLRP